MFMIHESQFRKIHTNFTDVNIAFSLHDLNQELFSSGIQGKAN